MSEATSYTSSVRGGSQHLHTVQLLLCKKNASAKLEMFSVIAHYSERLQNVTRIWKNGQNGRHRAGRPFLPFRAILCHREGYRTKSETDCQLEWRATCGQNERYCLWCGSQFINIERPDPDPNHWPLRGRFFVAAVRGWRQNFEKLIDRVGF